MAAVTYAHHRRSEFGAHRKTDRFGAGVPRRRRRREVQIVSRKPHDSLTPRQTVGHALVEPLRHLYTRALMMSATPMVDAAA